MWIVDVREEEISAIWEIAGSRVLVVGVKGSMLERICEARYGLLVHGMINSVSNPEGEKTFFIVSVAEISLL